MKLAFVYDACWPWETGGVQKRIWELSRRLSENHNVHWYGLKYWNGPDAIEREGVTFHGVGPPRELYVDERRSIPEALKFAAQIARPVARADVDVIDCQEFPYFPIFASKVGALRNRATLCVTWHEVWGEYWREYLGHKGVFGRAVERLSAYLPDAHLAVSELTRHNVSDLGAADVSLLPNGIDREEVESAPVADRPVDVLFVGRLIAEKGAHLLVDAVEKLCVEDSDISCVLVGEGPEENVLQETIQNRELTSNIEMLCFRECYDEVLGLMKAADVFVLPSRREGFGITVLEALACGTPVVTITHPRNAATELVADGETGAICEPTPTALATGIERARNEGEPTVCRAFAADYGWDCIARRAETLYLEMI